MGPPHLIHVKGKDETRGFPLPATNPFHVLSLPISSFCPPRKIIVHHRTYTLQQRPDANETVTVASTIPWPHPI